MPTTFKGPFFTWFGLEVITLVCPPGADELEELAAAAAAAAAADFFELFDLLLDVVVALFCGATMG